MKTLTITLLGVFSLLGAGVRCGAEGAAPPAILAQPTRTSENALLRLRGQPAVRLSERRTRPATKPATRPDHASPPDPSNEAGATHPVLMPQRGHTESVDSVAVSADGRLLLSGGDDRTMRLWDLATGAVIRTFRGHSGPVSAVAFSPDGRIVVSGSDDHMLRLWKTASGEPVQAIKAGGPITSVAFSPDGRRLLSAETDGILGLWDPASGKVIRKFGADAGSIVYAAFSPDGRRIASRAAPGPRLLLWDAASGALTREIRVDPSWHGLAFSPDGRRIAAGSGDALVLLDTGTGVPVRTFTSDPPSNTPHIVSGESRGWNVSSVALSPDGQRLMFRGAVFNVATAKPVHRFEGVIIDKFAVGEINFAPAAFTPDGRGIVTGLYGVLVLWDAATGATVRAFEGYEGYRASDYSGLTHAAAFSVDGRQVMSAGITPPRIWDLESGALVREIKAPKGSWAYAFSPDGRQLAASLRNAASRGNSVELRDVASGSVTREVTLSLFGIKSLAFSPDGHRVLASDGSSRLQLVDVLSGAAMPELVLPPRTQTLMLLAGDPFAKSGAAQPPIAFSPDGRHILSGRALVDRDVLERPCPRVVTKPEDLSCQKDEEKKITAMGGIDNRISAGAFSSDGKRVVSGTLQGRLALWKVDESLGGSLTAMKEFDGHAGAVMSVAFSPDGRRILSGGEDDIVRLWDADSGELVHAFTDHEDPVTSVAFSGDGRRLLSAAMGGSWRIWDALSFSPVMTMTALPNFEWIVEFPDGRYRASDGAGRWLAVVDGVKTLPMEPYEKKFRLSTSAAGEAR